MKVGYLGPIGSFTYTASRSAYPDETLIPLATISECIHAYEHQQVDVAVIPIENSIEGSVHQSIDYLFHKGDINVCHEIILPIAQQLMVVDKENAIEKIFSHPQALAQTEQFRNEYFPDVAVEMTPSTAYAARFIAEHPELPYAAIAPSLSAEKYQLEIIHRDIQDVTLNNTRFWVLGQDTNRLPLPKIGIKSSLALVLPQNLAGALYQALAIFSLHSIDLTKIESRPLKTVLGEYFFLLDMTVKNLETINHAITELKQNQITVKSFGIYDTYEIDKEF
ncbi:MAG: prephenate dehydratase [Streptococcaceae bacterium]|jgi:prephenate dehydratase|nr:prephenate dehydratase [Streptococcaceae bacterium]